MKCTIRMQVNRQFDHGLIRHLHIGRFRDDKMRGRLGHFGLGRFMDIRMGGDVNTSTWTIFFTVSYLGR